MKHTTGDPTLDAVVLLGSVGALLLLLVAMAAPMERYEAIGRVADRLLEAIFPPRDHER